MDLGGWRMPVAVEVEASHDGGMTRARFSCLLTGVSLAGLTASGGDAAGVEKWEAEVAALEARVAAARPALGGLVFAGSSSIRLWDVENAFPGLGAVNVGFGGSQIAECAFFAPRLIYRWRPRAVVFYAGDNDIAAGCEPERVADDFLDFATSLHAVLPGCGLYFLSIKPSPSRWSFWPRARAANARIRHWCETVGSAPLHYVDMATPLLGEDGRPREEFFQADRLHLNKSGYAAWQAVLAPRL